MLLNEFVDFSSNRRRHPLELIASLPCIHARSNLGVPTLEVCAQNIILFFKHSTNKNERGSS